MKHTTKLAMLAGSLATTLAVAVGAAVFDGPGPGTVSLIERTAAEEATTSTSAPSTTTLAPSTTVAPVAPQTTLAGRSVAPVTTKPASAAPATTVAPLAAPVATTAPAAATTTVPAPTWTVRYLDGSVKVLTSRPWGTSPGSTDSSPGYAYRLNERPKVDAQGIGTQWETYSCVPLPAPNYRCSEVTAYQIS